MPKHRQNYPSRVMSKRQSEVFALIRRGWNFKRIGDELHCTEVAARGAAKRVYDKLGVDNRVQAALFDADKINWRKAA